MDLLIDKLKKDYGIFRNDDTYYIDLISTYSGDIKLIREAILKDIRENWDNYNIDWFIDYANTESIENVIEIIKKYRLEINPIIIQNIISKCPKIEEYLKELASKKEKWSEDEIENTFDGTLFDIVYNYLIITNRIELRIEEDNEIGEINYDAYINDITKMYIKEIKKAQAFDKNHERIVKYNEYKKLAKATSDPELAKKYEDEVIKLRKLIVEGNLCLTIPMASKYRKQGVDYLDLMQEGSFGIMKALDRFDPSLSNSFSTYAMWWIRQSIRRYIMDYSRTVRIPVNMHEQYNRIRDFQNNYMKRYSDEPTIEEICSNLHMSRTKVQSLLKAFETPVSLDSPIKNEENELSDELYGFVSEEYDYDDDIYKSEFVKKVLSGLSPKQEFVIRMRFGLSNGKDKRFERPHTLEEIGKELDITREWVRQIEEKFINNVRKKEHIVVEAPNNKKNLYFWEYFSGYDENTVRKKLEYLSPKDLELIYSKYGKNLDDFVVLDLKQNSRVFSVLSKIKKMLKEPNYFPRYYNKYTDTIEPIKVYVYERIPLLELVKMDYDTIVSKLGSTSHSLDIIKSVFGPNLNQVPNLSSINQEEMKYLNNIVGNLMVDNIENNMKTMQEILDCNDEEFEYLINSHLTDNRKKKLIHFFGDSLKEKADFYLYGQADYANWLKTYENFKHKLVKMYEDDRTIKKLSSKTGKSESTVQGLIDNMDKESKIYQIINKYLNKEKLTYTEKALFENWCSALRNQKSDNIHIDNVYLDILLTRLDLSEQEFMLMYYSMNPGTVIFNILTKLINGVLKDNAELYILKMWLNIKVKNPDYHEKLEIPDEERINLFLNDVNFTKEEFINVISNIPTDSKRYKTIIKFINGEELSTRESGVFYTWKSNIRKIYREDIEVLLSKEHTKVSAPANIEVIRELIGSLDDNIRRVLELRLGLHDGTIYSIKEIMEIYGLSEDIVNEYISEGFNIINSSTDELKLKLNKKQ